MNETTLRSLQEGMHNIGESYYRSKDYWTRRQLDEAVDLLENKEQFLDEYDCYDYLFD
jgi:hypothetical protein